MPIVPEYKKKLKSHIADLKNSCDYAGAGTAAAFLKEFVKVEHWIHLDIAGVSRRSNDPVFDTPCTTGEEESSICNEVCRNSHENSHRIRGTDSEQAVRIYEELKREVLEFLEQHKSFGGSIFTNFKKYKTYSQTSLLVNFFSFQSQLQVIRSRLNQLGPEKRKATT